MPGAIAHQLHARSAAPSCSSPSEHRAPARAVRVAETDELQPGGGEHGEQRGAEEVGDDQRDHRRQHLEDDDVRPALAAHPRRLEEVAVAQRQRLRRAAGGRRTTSRSRTSTMIDDAGCPLPRVRGDHDDQRERRDHQEHVGDQRQRRRRRARRGRPPTRRRSPKQRREGADGEGDHQRLARAVDELGEDVLTERGRAEPVLPTTAAG